MYLPESSQLNIGYLSRLFDNTSNCYKFFWFKAILTKLEKGKTSFTFSELVDEMIKHGLNPADYGYGRFIKETNINEDIKE